MPGKVKYKNLNEKERITYLGEFYDMVALLESREEVKNFFKDLLTLSEVIMISRRIQIAKKLLKGESYQAIADKLGVGSATITNVDKWLTDGFGEYKNIIKKFDKLEKGQKNNELIGDENTPLSLSNIKRKYPAHFFLLNMLNKDK